jgi:hypothetical protein
MIDVNSWVVYWGGAFKGVDLSGSGLMCTGSRGKFRLPGNDGVGVVGEALPPATGSLVML